MQHEEFLVAKKRTVIVSGLSCCGATSYLHRMSVCTLGGLIPRELVPLCLYSTFSQDLSKNAPFVFFFTDREQLQLTESTREIIKTATTCSITLPTTDEGRDESVRVCVCVDWCVCVWWVLGGADKRPVEHLDAGDSSAHTRYEPN